MDKVKSKYMSHLIDEKEELRKQNPIASSH